MLKIIFFCLVAYIVSILCIIVVFEDKPIVYWSTSEDRCIKIVVKNEEFDCSKMPKNYEIVWVK